MKDNKSIPRSHKIYFEKRDVTGGEMKKSAVRSAGVVVFSRGAVYFINMFSVIVLARLVTPGDFGLVTMVIAPFGVLLDVGNLGLSEATIQSKEINHRQVSTLFWINVTLSLALASLLIVLAPLISIFYDESRLQSITIAIALIYIVSGLSTQHLALLRRNMQFYSITAIEITSSALSVVVAIALAWQGWGYWAIVSRYIVLSTVTTAGAWLLSQWYPGLPAVKTKIGPMLRFGINFLGSNIIYYFSKNLDKVLLGWRYGSQSLAYYDRAYHLFAMPLNQLLFPLGNVAFSALSRLRDDPERFRRYYLKSISMLGFLGMFLSAILTLTGRDLILLLLGPQWNTAGQIFTIFSLSIGISLIYMTFGWVNLSLGRADRQIRCTLLMFFMTVLFFAIGLPYGPFGVAIAFTAAPYILILPSLWYAGRPIDLKLSSMVAVIWKYYVAAFFAGALCWLALYEIESSAHIFAGLHIVARLLLSCVLCTSLYLILVVIFYQSIAPVSQFFTILREMVPLFGKKGDIEQAPLSSGS